LSCISVFVSPCSAKRKEGMRNPLINYVITFDELKAWFVATETNISETEPTGYKNQASREGREYALSGGVAKAVNTLVEEEFELKAHHINGINKQSIEELKKNAQSGECDCVNLIEVAC
jgi:iron only hydrogenase large subunit-like protein